MGKITNENHRSLENAQKYEDATLKGMMTGNEFNRALADLIDKKRIPIIKIVEKANVSKSYLNKLRNCSEKNLHPGRYVVIDIALALDAHSKKPICCLNVQNTVNYMPAIRRNRLSYGGCFGE